MYVLALLKDAMAGNAALQLTDTLEPILTIERIESEDPKFVKLRTESEEPK
jgi:hypothetical protein